MEGAGQGFVSSWRSWVCRQRPDRLRAQTPRGPRTAVGSSPRAAGRKRRFWPLGPERLLNSPASDHRLLILPHTVRVTRGSRREVPPLRPDVCVSPHTLRTKCVSPGAVGASRLQVLSAVSRGQGTGGGAGPLDSGQRKEGLLGEGVRGLEPLSALRGAMALPQFPRCSLCLMGGTCEKGGPRAN